MPAHQYGATTTSAEFVADVALRGRRAIVTAASSGIGVETARALAPTGADICLAVRIAEAGKKFANDVAEKLATGAAHASFGSCRSGPLPLSSRTDERHHDWGHQQIQLTTSVTQPISSGPSICSEHRDRTTALSATEQERQNRDIVRGIYEASFAGDVKPFVEAMDSDFEEYVPPVLPWGGLHRGPEDTLSVIPQVAAAIDFATMRLISLAADGDHVVALLIARTPGGDEIWIAEHWTLRASKVWRMRVFYHDTRPLESPRTATAS